MTTTTMARVGRLGVLVCAQLALANPAAGVSDERVVLPGAPGSIDGVGENASVEGNQGAMRYRVSVDVPKGFPGLTPDIDFSYSSSSGSGPLGIGWSMPAFSIERMTSKGLQQYALTDRFVVDGSDELVRVSESGGDAVYRSRFESGFVRWTWKSRGSGEEGYWTAEYPDGRVGTFGADAQGVSVLTAQVRVPSTARVWRWNLTQIADPHGHVMRFTWTKDGSGHPLLDRIEYVFDGASPRHSVRFTWEGRSDVISNATPGFELRLTQRLKDVRIFSGTTNPELVRAYVLNYEADGMSGGASRLASVARLGQGMAAYPVTFRFGYSKTLGGACGVATTDPSCEKPFVRDMGSLPGVDFSTGRAALIDMNGDALPDVVFSDQNGVHNIFSARLDGEGRTSFNPTPRASARTTGSSPFVIGDPRVQVIDVNGDGFVDITQAKVPAVLCNKGTGDWEPSTECVTSAPGLPSAFTPEDDADMTQADPKFVRFFDYDNDRRIDWLRTLAGGTTTEVLANSITGFNSVTVQNIGLVFDESPLQLADMNGDGLQDPAAILASGAAVQVQYKLNYGYGNWQANWSTITLSGLDPSQATVAELQDINGDGLADVVAVSGNEVRFALNRNGDRFEAVQTLQSANLGSGTIPVRASNTVVAYADMNGNGSDDIVWIQPSGQVQYLELFPIRPNLIARIDNGIGAVQQISYGTSIVEQARDAMANMPWNNRVPNSYSMVKRLESFVTLTGSDTGGLKEIISYRYHSGFYDGVEKQFRGYEQVERELLSDMSRDAQEPGLLVDDYDVGKMTPALAGTRLRGRVYAGMGAGATLLTETGYLLAECPVADVGMTTPPISFQCLRSVTTTFAERDVANAVTTRTEYDYDGFGNVTAERELGVIHFGTTQQPRACDACTQSGSFGKPCGAMCTGDERYTVREYITPGPATNNKWFLNKARRDTEGAVEGMSVAETLYFYDGNDFEGAANGLTKGLVSRAVHRFGPGANDVVTERFRYDSHGNLVERIEPNGAVANTATQRRLATFDTAGLNITSTEIRLGGTVQAMKRDYVWDVAWEQVAQSSNWYAVINGQPAAPVLQTRYRYDEHNRTVRVLEQGDTDANPSQEFVFELGDPTSRFLVQTRSSATSGLDVVEARCLDGKGRIYQTRKKLDAMTWQVSGFTEFDARGVAVRRFQPYTATTGACEPMPPTGVPFVRYTFDPLGRQTSEVEEGTTRRTEYRPLIIRRFDENDTDSASPFFNTPTIEEYDGLNRLIAFQRSLTTSGPQPRTQIQYDALGRISSVRDPAGTVKTQTYDAMDRVLTVADPNAGTTRFEYDANGNAVRSVDARNKVVRSTYDGANRMTAMWDEADENGTKMSWTYDHLTGCTDCTNLGGELAETRYPAGAERRGYDTKGNLTYLERSIDGVSFVTRRRYDGAEREISTTFPSGIEVQRTYDGAGRVTSIPNYVTRVDYDARGRVQRLTASNGVVTDYGFDSRIRLSSLKTTLKDGSALLDLSYTRDKVGNLLTVGEATARAVRHGATLTYDAWDRPRTMALTRASGDPETLTFGFDDVDNITSVTSSLGAASKANVGAYTYTANKPNAVGKAGELELGYDERGNVATRGGTTYARDAFNRLTRAEKNGVVTAFTWAGGSERAKRVEGVLTTLYAEPDFEVRDGIGNLYVRLGDLRVARAQTAATAPLVLSDLAPATGAGSAKTVMGDRVIDISDAWLAQAASINAVQLSGGPAPSPVTALLASSARRLLLDDVTWLHADHSRSAVAATDVNGAARAEQSFYPFGETRGSTGFVDAYGFTGAEHVRGSGLLHFEFRELDPTTGRWTSIDPAFAQTTDDNVDNYGQSLGGYVYVANNFANYTDPTGLGLFGRKSSSGNSNKQSTPTTTTGKAPKSPKEKVSRAKAVTKGIAIALALVSALVSVGGAIGAASADDSKEAAQRSAVAGAVGQSVAAVGTIMTSGLDIHRSRAKAKEKKAAKQQASTGTTTTTTPPPPNATTPPSNNSATPPQQGTTTTTTPVVSTPTVVPTGVPSPSNQQTAMPPHTPPSKPLPPIPSVTSTGTTP